MSLKRKAAGIPLPLLASLLTAGVVAAFVVATITVEATVPEPLTVSVVDDLAAEFLPGESDTFEISVTKAHGTPAYTLAFAIDSSYPSGVSETAEYSADGGTHWAPYISGTELSMPADERDFWLKLTYAASTGAATGTISVSVDVIRT